MLAEMALASAAFSTIKQFVADGKELHEMGQSVVEYFSAKQKIQEKAHKNGYKSDLEAFLAAEQLKKQEEDLKNMMVWQGRAGMWEDWLKFQSDQKRARDAEEKRIQIAKIKKKEAIKNSLMWGGVIVLSLSLIGGGIAGLLWLISLKG